MRYNFAYVAVLAALLSNVHLHAQSPINTKLSDNAESLSHRNQLIAEQTLEIFRTHCADCHTPDVKEPGGGFDFILDLFHVAEDPAYVIPGQPEKSYIWQVIRDNEMPPNEPGTIPLTAHQKEIVKWWIEIGAPANTATPGPDTETTADNPIDLSPPPPISFQRRLIEFLGQFHPPSTHFPIALLIAAAFAELLLILTKSRTLQPVVRFCLWTGAFTALLTTALGLFNATYLVLSENRLWILDAHRILGIVTTTWAFISLAFLEYSINRSKCKQRTTFRLMLLLGAILVCLTGFFGGALVFGINHYVWPF